MEVNILGVSEVHWPGTGMIKSKGKVFYYSDNGSIDQNHQRGVGILMDENLQKSVKNFIPLSERVILIQLLDRPININIIQDYAPTAEKAEDEIEDFYRQLDQVLRLTKSNEINLVLGDFNAKVGKGRLGSVVGNYGLGERNDRGEKLIQYCEENNLTITNRWYKLPSRRLYTCKSPQDNDYRIVRNQIDYILINNRFKNLITKVTTMPGADIESDHNPLRANILLRFAKPKRKSLRKNLDPKLLRDQQKRSMNENHIKIELESIVSTNDIEKHWLGIKQAFKNTNENLLTANRTTAKNEWMSEDILKMMEQRRQFKIQNNHNEYKSMQRKILNKIRTAKETWLKERCIEAENLSHLGDSFHLHKKVKEIAGLHHNNSITLIKTDENKIVTETEELLQTWRNYTINLFQRQKDQKTLQLRFPCHQDQAYWKVKLFMRLD
ncbi:craniofacial development protein 2-like [Sitophilus oryzae]|uniref:Craniofacial development protein 2-like n=1 Tax=Sitophilus oryzae TaxID=7048 RepID=A0A6J2YKL9_SITOR|nr:craniofacial development protein 2-like [Sitophilus oryzae]